MTASFSRITLVSVSGLPDASGAARALAFSQAQMPGSRAVLCSPVAPDGLGTGISHVPLAPMNYHEYCWFMLFALWRVVHTEFALVVQDDGWVLDGNNWSDDYLNYDYVGAPIHLAKVESAQGVVWRNQFEWASDFGQPGCSVTPVQNGGFSLRSQRLMRALVDHPHVKVEVPPPDAVQGQPLRMFWHNNALLEDVQLTAVLRPALEAVGVRFAPLELARDFSVEHAAPLLHQGFDAMKFFGHHAKLRKLQSLVPLTLRSGLRLSELDQIWGERDLLTMFERRGYNIEFADKGVSATAASGLARRKV